MTCRPRKQQTDEDRQETGRVIMHNSLRWTRLLRQFGGLAKVDQVGFYAASCSIISAVA